MVTLLLTVTTFSSLSLYVAAEDPPESLIDDWFFEGFGTYFEITNSDYLNISLTSSENVYVILSSFLYSVDYYIESNRSVGFTFITLSGFKTNKNYHMYEDGELKNDFIVDNTGSYSYIQDLTQTHNISINEEIFELLQPQGYVEGNGTYFEITNSNYLNITFTSSENIDITLKSKPYTVDYQIQSNCEANSTNITISGFESYKTYYLYQDGILFDTFILDDNESYSYTQDLNNRHHVYTQEGVSTIQIMADGSINPSTAPITRNGNIYTLTDNIYEALHILKSGVTLDGDGYTIQTTNWWDVRVIYVARDLNDIIITNINVVNNLESSKDGICVFGGSIKIFNSTVTKCSSAIYSTNAELIIENCTISNNNLGISVDTYVWVKPIIIRNCYIANNTNYGINGGSNYKTIIEGNTIINNGEDGIGFTAVKGQNYIFNNSIISNGKRGIGLGWVGTNTEITNNTFKNNNNGIHIFYGSDYVKIKNNDFYNNNIGVAVQGSNYNNISNNIFSNNNYGIYMWYVAENNIVYQNTISNNNYIGVSIESGGGGNNNKIFQNIINNNDLGIYFFVSTDNSIDDNYIVGNNLGIYIQGSRYTIIKGNAILDSTRLGIYLTRWCTYANVTENTIYNCTVGIQLYLDAHYNTIYKNCVENNTDYGFWCQYSWHNTFYHNTITNNGIQAYDYAATKNNWHHPILLEGNYWSDYCGLDDGSGTGKHSIAGDGIGDAHIPHPTTYYDFYPLMNLIFSCDYGCPICNEAPIADADGPYDNALEGSPVLFNASGSSDPDGDPLQYRWDFDNDGTWDTNYSTNPTISYTWDDDYTGTVTVEVSDGDLIDIATTTVIVNNVAPTADAGVNHTGDEPSTFTFTGSHTDPGILDTHTYEWDFNYDGVTFNVEATGNNLQHTWKDDFNGTVALRVTDDDGGWHIGTCKVTVNNVAPTITSLYLPIDPLAKNTPVDLTATFIDPGILDTHTATINWGDGNTTNGNITGTSGTYNVSSSWTYGQAGVYTITLSIEDDDGGNDIEQFRYVVVYDPSGGFVTGGGWINSPEGAYKPDINLTGKANFGFVSKYKQGQPTPSGNTQFNFKVADLNFHSNNYDWLVIAGAKAMYKGTGTINNEGSYKFILSAIDEDKTPSTDTDMFRIKIWEEDELGNEIVIYDNNIGDDDFDSNPETQISGGNIVIHNT